jgi:hypothetical protein
MPVIPVMLCEGTMLKFEKRPGKFIVHESITVPGVPPAFSLSWTRAGAAAVESTARSISVSPKSKPAGTTNGVAAAKFRLPVAARMALPA